MAKTYKDILAELEQSIKEIEQKGISIKPLNESINELKKHSENIENVESNLEAVRQEVIEPIKEELNENKRAGKFSIFGFWVGALGLIISIASIIWTTFLTPKPNLDGVFISSTDSTKSISSFSSSEGDNALRELILIHYGLVGDYKPLGNELLINQLETRTILTKEQDTIRVEAYMPGERKVNGKWYPIVELKFSIDNKFLGISGLKELVKIQNKSGIAQLNENLFRIDLSEGDAFSILFKTFEVVRIFRKDSNILTVSDDKDAVLLRFTRQ